MSGLAKVIYNVYKNNIPTEYVDMSGADRDEAIRKEIFKILGLESYSRKEFRQAWRQHKNEVYNLIEELCDQVMVDGEAIRDAFFNQFVETRNLALGDKNEFYVEGENELELVEFSGSHFDLRRTRIDVGQNFSVGVKNYGIKVYEYFERVMAGRCDFAKLVELIAVAINKKMAELARETMTAALANLPAVYNHNGSYNEDAIMQLIAHVEAATGEAPRLVGTKTAIRRLQGVVDTKWSNDMKNERNQNGFITTWNGYSCVELQQSHAKGNETFLMPDDTIYVLTGNDKPVKMVFEGDTEVKEISDGVTNADRTVEQVVTLKMGASVIYNKMLGVIKITA